MVCKGVRNLVAIDAWCTCLFGTVNMSRGSGSAALHCVMPAHLPCSFTSLWFLSTTTPTIYSLVGSLNKVPLALIGWYEWAWGW